MASTQCLGVDCDYAKLRKLGTDTVTVLVGPEGKEEEFLILVDLARQHSQTIATKLETLANTEDARLHMPEYSASHFRLFVSFIYTGKIYSATGVKKDSHLLCALWIFGQALKSTTLKDAVTDAMIKRRAMTHRLGSNSNVALVERLQIKEQTQKGVGKFLVDTAVTCSKHRIYTDARSTNPGCLHFFGEVIKGLDRIRRGVESQKEILSRVRTGTKCVYHEHGTSEICYKKMFPAARDSLRQLNDAMPRIDEIMTGVHVGPEDAVERLAVRKDLAIRHSEIIKKALDPESGWKEAKENIVHFP